MKKALVALAIAGVVAPVAHADNVVIYGRLNTAYQYTKIQNGVKDGTLANQSSRFGFKGEEKIGDLTAEFQIENGFDSTAGGDTLASRDTFVGLKGDFGGIRLGKNETPTWKLFDQTISKFHHTGVADFSANDSSTSSAISGIGQWGARFAKSAIYTSPNLNGVTLSAQIADKLTGTPVTFNNAAGVKEAADLGVSYAVGPITAGISARLGKDATTNKRDSLLLVAGKYKVDQFDVGLAYERNDMKSATVQNTVVGAKRNAFYASGQYNVAPNAAVVASLAYAGKIKVGGNTVADSGAIQYVLGGQYDLSKRTQVYGYYTKLDNKANASYSFVNTGTNNVDNQAFVMGVRHNF
jgi:predicted porin